MKNRNVVCAMILFGSVCVGLSQTAQAIFPVPDGGYAGSNTAEGHTEHLSLAVRSCNPAIGSFSPSTHRGGNINTAIGAGVFLPTILAENTRGGIHLSDIILFLLFLLWLGRGLASVKAIWQAVTNSQKGR